MNRVKCWTPRPWVIDPETRPAEVCTIHGLPDDESTNNQGFAYVRGALGHWPNDEGEEEMANAILITAAPDLVEALEDLLAYVEDGYGDHESLEGAQARAALSKAYGEQS